MEYKTTGTGGWYRDMTSATTAIQEDGCLDLGYSPFSPDSSPAESMKSYHYFIVDLVGG